MELIGYTCPYVPVELLAATGLKPYCLLHGDMQLAQEGEKYVRIDACPLVKSNLAYILNNQKKFAAIVGTTGCDMIRRMFEVIDEMTKIPVYVLHNPRTDRPQIFYDEIEWLKSELEHLSHKNLTDEILGIEIERWEKAREQFRSLDHKRKANPARVSTSYFHRASRNYYSGNPDISMDIQELISDKPRVYLIGSEITYESSTLLELLEQKLNIVGDFACGLSQFLSISVRKKTFEGIKQAYYYQPSQIYKRPNKKYYDYIESQLKARRCAGIIAWTLDYCDTYEFELRRMERRFGVPLLKIRSNISFQNVSQLKTRISAFKEMLCSRS